LIVFGGKTSELLVGFLIGVASMLSQLFFVLAVIAFGVGVEATTNGWTTAPSDKAYGAFAVVNTIIYAVWAIILSVHRKAVTSSSQEQSVNQTYDENNTGEVYNPTNENVNVNANANVNVSDEAEL